MFLNSTMNIIRIKKGNFWKKLKTSRIFNFSRCKFSVRENSAFTLIEIIIVLAIVAVLSTLVTLSLSRANSQQTLDKGALTIVSLLNEARSSAISSKDFSDY